MAFGDQVPDKTILRDVGKRLSRKGGGSSRIVANVSKGDVTLTGSIRYEHERRLFVRDIGSVPGVRRVIDRLQVANRRPNG